MGCSTYFIYVRLSSLFAETYVLRLFEFIPSKFFFVNTLSLIKKRFPSEELRAYTLQRHVLLGNSSVIFVSSVIFSNLQNCSKKVCKSVQMTFEESFGWILENPWIVGREIWHLLQPRTDGLFSTLVFVPFEMTSAGCRRRQSAGVV